MLALFQDSQPCLCRFYFSSILNCTASYRMLCITKHMMQHLSSQDGPSRSALYLLSSYLPKKSVTGISRGTLQTLASLSHLAKPRDYSALLVALVAWQQTGPVIKLINQWLVQEFSSSRDVLDGGSGALEKTSTHAKKNSTHVNKTKVTLEITYVFL